MIGKRTRILIIGAGGYARMIGETLLGPTFKREGVELTGYLDDDLKLHGMRILGKPVHGPIADLKNVPHDSVVIGIGDNRTRARMFQQLAGFGEEFSTLIHPSAVIAPSVAMGRGTVVFARVVVNAHATIEDNAILNTGCTVGHNCAVASHAHICAGAHLGGTVRVGIGAYIGLGSSILQNSNVGEWATVESKAMVISDVSANTIVGGVPAVTMT